MKFIDTPTGVINKMAKIFNVSRCTVWKSLNYHNNSELAQRIRKAAMENGGVEKLSLPVWETFHDADGYMRQYYPNGAKIEINKSTGDVVAYFKEAVVVRMSDISFPELERLQKKMKEYKSAN